MYKSNILLSINWKNLVYLLYTRGWVERDVEESSRNQSRQKKSGNMWTASNQRLISKSMTMCTISMLLSQLKRITKQKTLNKFVIQGNDFLKFNKTVRLSTFFWKLILNLKVTDIPDTHLSNIFSASHGTRVCQGTHVTWIC